MILGVDVSKWQGELSWYHCREAGARFAFIRAGSCTAESGICYTDDQFERNAEIGPSYMPVGFYWYLRPYHDVTKQAQYFCNLVKGKNWVLPLVADCEAFGGLTAEQATRAVVEFVKEINHRTATWPMIYTRAALWNASTVSDEVFGFTELWIARYTAKTYPWGNPGDKAELKPRDWDTWRIWQFSADGNGRGGEFGARSDSIDLNYFNGDEGEFLIWSGQAVSELVKVSKAAAGVYAGPQGPMIGTTWRGRAWRVIHASTDGEWLRVEAWLRKKDVSVMNG